MRAEEVSELLPMAPGPALKSRAALSISFAADNGKVDSVSLKGPARMVYAGELTAESLLDLSSPG